MPTRHERFFAVLRQAFHVAWTLLDGSGRRRMGALFALMGGLALLEILGVGSILPFVALLVDPGLADRNPHLLAARQALGIEGRETFIAVFGAGVTGIVALTNLVNTVLVIRLQRFTWGEGARLAERLLRGWLAWPWVRQAGLHSAEVARLLFTEVGRAVSNVLIPLLTLSARTLAIAAIAGTLFVIDPLTTAATFLLLGGCYVAIFVLVRRRLAEAATQAVTARALAHRIAIETFGGLKDVRIYGAEGSMAERFSGALRLAASCEARAQIAAQLPRYVLETLAFGGLAAVAIAQLAGGRGQSAAISLVATFAFAGYRVLPALQQAYGAAALLRANVGPASELAEVARDLASEQGGAGRAPLPSPEAMDRRGPPGIRLEGVAFRFPGVPAPTLADVSLTIPGKSFVLVVGETGSGKTTLVDLIAGLLEPTSGRILVDGDPLTPERLPAWRARLGYVAQHPMLLDDTLAANVAFGRSEGSEAEIAAAVAGAKLDAAVRALPEGIATRIGERGGRLSGGQRQRLAIARALFRRADVLILDESTSALDEDTERAVLETLAALRGRITILMISHRPAARFDADLVVRVAGGTATLEAPWPERAGRAARS